MNWAHTKQAKPQKIRVEAKTETQRQGRHAQRCPLRAAHRLPWLSAEPPPISFVRRSLGPCTLQNDGGVFSEASIEIIWTPLRPIHSSVLSLKSLEKLVLVYVLCMHVQFMACPLQWGVLVLLSPASYQKALSILKASLMTIFGLLSSCISCGHKWIGSAVPFVPLYKENNVKYSRAVLASGLNLLLFGFQIQTQMILILLPLKASMTPWILIVYLKRHSGACVGNMHHTWGKRRDGEYLTDITSFNNGQLRSHT